MPCFLLKPTNPEDEAWHLSTHKGNLLAFASSGEAARILAASRFSQPLFESANSPWLRSDICTVTQMEHPLPGLPILTEYGVLPPMP